MKRSESIDISNINDLYNMIKLIIICPNPWLGALTVSYFLLKFWGQTDRISSEN